MTQILKWAFSVNFLKIVQVFFGFYSDISKHKLVNTLARIYCGFIFIGFAGLQAVAFLAIQSKPVAYHYTVVLTDLCLKILFSLVTKDEYFSVYCNGIIDIDSLMFTSPSLTSVASHLLIYNAVFFNMMSACFVCLKDEKTCSVNFFLYVLSAFSFCASCVSFTKITAVCDLLYTRMKSLRKIFKEQMETLNSTELDKIVYIENYINVYKNIITNVDSMSKIIRVSTFSAVLATLFRVIFLSYYCIHSYGTPEDIDQTYSWIMNLIPAIAVTCAPPLLLEAAANEAEEAKLLLADHLLGYTDKNFRQTLYDALEYMDVRPTTVTIWPKYPINMSLFLGFIGSCVTYNIALLQFKY